MTNKQLECVELLGYTSQGAVRIHGGGNNRLFILKTEPACIAKIYHQDEKNRALHDVKISELFAQNGINNIAKPLDWDLANHVAIFDFLDGEKPDKINKKYIHQIADFIANINSNKIRSYLDKTFHAA
ncbi:MAG: hypothetical protein GY908_04040, partial [Flavobacteriales bacterium]|nr:hypothetical protein [Flavobacteriales bacterium]